MKITYSNPVKSALKNRKPVLALESTIIAHGMPYPSNLDFAQKAELLCTEEGVVPATVAILDGEIHVGLAQDELKRIAKNENVKKVSRRELGLAISGKWTGATTVSSTAYIAHAANIPVFATGGIGGVHRDANRSFDISQDLTTLSNTPIIVVSAGAKAILDLPKTLELLETLGVIVVGYKTDEFPAFYSRQSGCVGIPPISSPDSVSNLYKNQVELGQSSSILVANPVPKELEIPAAEIESIINDACNLAKEKHILGKELTPFLLQTISNSTGGQSLKTNIALALNNISLGIKICKAL